MVPRAYLSRTFLNLLMVMNKLLCILLLVALSGSACKKLDVPKGTPACVKQRIKEMKEAKGKCLDRVYSYDWQGQKIYRFVKCDGFFGFYDEKCKIICLNSIPLIPDPSIPDCSTVLTQAENETLIWTR